MGRGRSKYEGLDDRWYELIERTDPEPQDKTLRLPMSSWELRATRIWMSDPTWRDTVRSYGYGESVSSLLKTAKQLG
jgi:hypothetical protein